jgi:hypothetical protein
VFYIFILGSYPTIYQDQEGSGIQGLWHNPWHYALGRLIVYSGQFQIFSKEALLWGVFVNEVKESINKMTCPN